jgi:cell division protein FtsB
VIRRVRRRLAGLRPARLARRGAPLAAPRAPGPSRRPAWPGLRRPGRPLRRRWVILAGLAALVVAAVLGDRGLLELWRLRREITTLYGTVQDLEAENARLARQISALRDDPTEIERIAREELGLVRPGERVLRFPRTGRPGEPGAPGLPAGDLPPAPAVSPAGPSPRPEAAREDPRPGPSPGDPPAGPAAGDLRSGPGARGRPPGSAAGGLSAGPAPGPARGGAASRVPRAGAPADSAPGALPGLPPTITRPP